VNGITPLWRSELNRFFKTDSTMQNTTYAPFYLAKAMEKHFDQQGDGGQTPTERVPGVADHSGRTEERGFTIVELIVVMTVISILSALAAGAYNKVVNDAKQANASALVSTLATAKTAFVTDHSTSPIEIQQFNSDPDASFASIAPFIRVNGVQPASEDDLRKLDGLPASTSISLGTVDDSRLGGSNADQAPTVTFTHARR
jgi:prepilin-type N-terminal cleavage/methylation domain-containing protein